jgi:Domain of unknown function (DUF6817)
VPWSVRARNSSCSITVPRKSAIRAAHCLRICAAFAGQLAAWDAAGEVVLAGLCHAAYGTDGFATALLPPTERAEVVDVIGAAAEAVVYLYCSCDRDATYPLFGDAGPVAFHDRFTGAVRQVDDAEMRAFLEITAAKRAGRLGPQREIRGPLWPGSAGALHARPRPALADRLGRLPDRATPDRRPRREAHRHRERPGVFGCCAE